MNRMFSPHSNAPKFKYYIQMSYKDMKFGYAIVSLTQYEANNMRELGQTYFAGKVVIIESIRRYKDSEDNHE